MGHFYELYDSGRIETRHDSDMRTAKQKGYFPSVTTKLKLPSSDFLDAWRHKQAVLAAETHWRKDGEDDNAYCDRIDQMLWGVRTRWDGQQFNSNDFGTCIHEQLEHWNLDHDYQFAEEWRMYCEGWPSEYNRLCSRTEGAELMVACPLLKVAGSVDLLAWDHEERLSILDFKARPHVKEDGTPKVKSGLVREKDCQQLVLEADMIRRQRGLDYLPKCYSVIICTESGAYYIHEWTDYMMRKQLDNALAINLAYNVLNGFETIEEAMNNTTKVKQGEK